MLRPPTPIASLQNEVSRRNGHQSIELNLHVGSGVAITIDVRLHYQVATAGKKFERESAADISSLQNPSKLAVNRHRD